MSKAEAYQSPGGACAVTTLDSEYLKEGGIRNGNTDD